mgnify:CR=1 FL=1
MTGMSPHAEILYSILNRMECAMREQNPVSARELSAETGISTTRIRSHIDYLRDHEGLDIESIRGRGYLLTDPPRHLHRMYLHALLAHEMRELPVYLHAKLGSTNDEAQRLLREEDVSPFFVCACQQTHGRGRMQRNWLSDSSSNLYLSMACRPPATGIPMNRFTQWIGLALCKYLDESYDMPVTIKWPNDLYCRGRKLAGILTESRTQSWETTDMVVGVGLNINMDSAAFPLELRDDATSMKQECGTSLDLNRVAAGVLLALYHAYESFLAGTHKHAFRPLWIDYDCLNGQQVTVSQSGQSFEARACGVDERGGLMLVLPDGERIVVSSGDVSIRPH